MAVFSIRVKSNQKTKERIMKKLALIASAVVIATSSFAAENNKDGWFAGTYYTSKSTKADILTESTSGASSKTGVRASSGGTGLAIGHMGNVGRTSLEFDKTSKNKGIESSQMSLAFDMIARSSFVDPILGFDVGYNKYSVDHLGTINDFTLGTLGLRAGLAKIFAHHQFEVLYRYAMAFGEKRGNTIYQTSFTNFEDQSLSSYKSSEVRVGYSYRF